MFIAHLTAMYINTRWVLNNQIQTSRRHDNADLEFLSVLLNSSLDVPDLLAIIHRLKSLACVPLEFSPRRMYQ